MAKSVELICYGIWSNISVVSNAADKSKIASRETFPSSKERRKSLFQKCRLGTMSGSTSRLRATVASVCRKMPRELRKNHFFILFIL